MITKELQSETIEPDDEYEPFQIFDNYEDDNEAIKTVVQTELLSEKLTKNMEG